MSDTYQTRLHIGADIEAVFDHFVNPELLVTWMGDFARLDAVNDGIFSVDINGVLIRGTFIAVERPHRLEIAWGEAGNSTMPPGSTRLVITFTPVNGGTELVLAHSALTAVEAAKHAIGWPHFLERLQMAAAGKNPGRDPWAT